MPATPHDPAVREDESSQQTGDFAGDNHTADGERRNDAPAAAAPSDRRRWPLRPPQAADELGRLAGFRVTRLLGEGGMGAVFAAEDPVVRRRVALKVMKPELTARPEFRERFLREARTAAAVEHDHIIPVLQDGEDDGTLFIAMPLLQGESLATRLNRDHRLPLSAIVKLGRETAEGLAAAHAQGLVHRDVKPANLWLEGKAGFRRVKILDFGLARAVHDDTHLTTAGGVLGTPAYMSPEQADGQAVDQRSDLFSLGAVLYRCCTGEAPFPGATTMAILSALANKAPAPVREKNPDVPPALADLVMRLLAKRPEERPASADEVAETLRRIEQESAAVTASPSLPVAMPVAPSEPPAQSKPVMRRPSRRALVALAVMAGLGLAVAAAVITIKVRGPDGKETEVTAPTGSKAPENVPDRHGFPPLDPGWLARTITLPSDEQVKEVAAELAHRNPGFADSLQVGKNGDGQVTDVCVMTSQLEDPSPFQGFPALRALRVTPSSGIGKVSDTSCLWGMNLTSLDLAFNHISDLSPLSDMPLSLLAVGDNPIHDLAPLGKMKLHVLGIPSTYVDDLSPLEPIRITRKHYTNAQFSCQIGGRSG